MDQDKYFGISEYQAPIHSVLPEPPIVISHSKWDEQSRTLSYDYNGRVLMSIVIPGVSEIGYRHGSDSAFQSMPGSQQWYVMQEDDRDGPVMAKVKMQLSGDAVNMRPNRAGSEEAILGQVGRPLMYGVNGLYDITQDLLISWLGCKWNWTQDRLTETDDGLTVTFEVEISRRPWFINVKMQYYRTHLGYSHHKPWQWRPNPKPVTGWCSWESFRRDVNQQNIEEASELFGRTLKDYGFEYIQLDDGYLTLPIPPDPNGLIADSMLNPNDQFPLGHEGIVSEIKSHGLAAGIWTVEGAVGQDFVEAQPECALRDKAGKPIDCEWVNYVMDCTPETLKKHAAPYYKGLKEKGYTYFKTDALRHLIYDGLHEAVRLGVLTNDQAHARFRGVMQNARDNIGEDAYLLACWGVFPELVGLIDACRIAMDANPTWAGFRMQLVETARWFYIHRILFLNDPDHICVRGKIEWVQSACSLVSLSGGLFMLSDPLDDYDEERLDLVKKNIPPLTTMPGETGQLDMSYPGYTWTKLHGFAVPREKPVSAKGVSDEDAANMAGEYPTMNDDHPFSSLWAFHLDTSFRRWCVIGRFATVPLHDCEVQIESLGLEPEHEYVVFDFWAQQYLGRVSKRIKCKELDVGCCQVLSFSPVLNHPQLIASSRHVSMDAVSIKSQSWTDNVLSLDLLGVPKTTETYWFHCPEGFVLGNACCKGAVLKAGQDKELISVEVNFENRECFLEIKFNNYTDYS